MPCDHTSQIDRFLVRRKVSGPMDSSSLLNGEFAFGNTEKCLYVKDATSSTVYQFGKIIDSLTVNANSVWSSTYTKDYIDSAVSKPKTILLTAGGLNPTQTSGCSVPYVASDDTIPKVFVDFTSGTYGFWNISIPTDYTGSLSKISIIYSGPAVECSWVVQARILTDNDAINSGGSWSSAQTITDTPANADRLEIADNTGNITMLGSAANANKFVCIRLNLSAGTGTYKLLQLKLEYY